MKFLWPIFFLKTYFLKNFERGRPAHRVYMNRVLTSTNSWNLGPLARRSWTWIGRDKSVSLVTSLEPVSETEKAETHPLRLHLTPLTSPHHFFLWVVLKDKVYSRKPRNIPDLKDKIRQKCGKIIPATCEKVTRYLQKYKDTNPLPPPSCVT